MRDPERINRILGMLKELWEKSPDQRFGQLLINLRLIEDNIIDWNQEDSDTEQLLRSELNAGRHKRN